MRKEEIIVIGAGASGMMAAITAARSGGRVLLLEKLKKPGKKLLATGNGKCNFTNCRQERDCYRGEDPDFIWTALQDFSQERVLGFFHEIGILPRARDGYCYPASGQAGSVVDALVRQLNQWGVALHTGETVQAVCPEPEGKAANGFSVLTDRESYHAKRVVLATGGMAAPVHGTTGDGYQFVRKMGLDIIEPLPALTSCVLKGVFSKEWAGVRVSGSVALFTRAGKALAQDQGELQMVAYGLSGIPVFQISRYAARALAQGDQPYLLMDIMPDYTPEKLEEELASRRERFPKWTAVDALDGILPRRLAKVLLKSLGMDPGVSLRKWMDPDIDRLAKRMKGWKLGIAAVSGFDKAQVTAGGVLTNQLDPATMEVKSYPGLYLTGEILDVDGICGGYNLQWAWTSGYLAGRDAALRLQQTGSYKKEG